MAETKLQDCQESVAISGVVERETTPAPPLVGRTEDEWTGMPSARPTSVPEFDLAALAFESSRQSPRLPSIPLDVAFPSRTRALPPEDLALRSAFVLLHVDGRSSVRHIAEMVDLPADEVLACLLQLTAAGLVELGPAAAPAHGVPPSGDRPEEDAKPDSR